MSVLGIVICPISINSYFLSIKSLSYTCSSGTFKDQTNQKTVACKADGTWETMTEVCKTGKGFPLFVEYLKVMFIFFAPAHSGGLGSDY